MGTTRYVTPEGMDTILGTGHSDNMAAPAPFRVYPSATIRKKEIGALVGYEGMLVPPQTDEWGLLKSTSGEVRHMTSNGVAVTAAGASANLIAPPLQSGYVFLIKYLMATNVGGATSVVSWTGSVDTRLRYRAQLINGQTYFRDFGSGFFVLENEGLRIHLSVISNIEWALDYQIGRRI